MKEKIIKKLSFQDKKKKEDVNEDTHLQKRTFRRKLSYFNYKCIVTGKNKNIKTKKCSTKSVT